MADENALTETLHAVHRTLYTTRRIKGYMREFENPYHVAIVYTPSEALPALGAIVNTSRPDREHAEPFDVKVVEIILQAPLRGPEGNATGMGCNLVIGRIE